MSPRAVRLHLVRHGETAHNRDGIGLGRADVPLTERGRRQAGAAVERLALAPPGRILTSPLARAGAIARPLAERTGAPLEVRAELIELDVGETEGLPLGEIVERFPAFAAAWRGPDQVAAAMPGGESLAQLAARLEPLAAELFALPDEGGGDVAVVSHNFVLRLLVCRLLGLDPAAFRAFTIDLASISTLSLRRGRAVVERLNDRCHLPGDLLGVDRLGGA